MAEPPGEDEIRIIYRATIDALYRYVVSRCDGDRDLAEDVTQETWLRAVCAWHTGGVPREPAAWLTTVAHNILANHFRRRRDQPLDDSHLAVAAPAVGGADDRHSLVHRALARLPAANLRLLQAFHFQRKGVAEIAGELGVTERAIEGRLRRARRQLRTHMESEADPEGDRS
jgi:RNA polymerase sigma-70 factor (ECF subfamily)